MRKICRGIFSRYFFSAVIILLELALLLALILYASGHSVRIFLCMLIINVAALISLINRDANPEYKVSWLVVMTLVPFFGVALYLLFYSRKLTKREASLMKKIYESLASSDGSDESYSAFSELCALDQQAAGRALAIMNDDALSEVYRCTVSSYFPLGEHLYTSMLEDISRAQRYIFLEYFIIEEGVMWQGISERLRERAAAGVEVRIIYDDIGCMRTLPRGFSQQLAKQGIKCLCYSPISPRVSTVHNNRDHRKICVIDGKIAYTGGVNIADEYINKKERFGHWKDGGIRLEGAAALGFARLFLSSWDFASGSVSDKRAFLLADLPAGSDDGGYYIPFGSGPAPIYKRSVGKAVFMNLINQAKEYVYITTPYLVIDYDLTEALRNASLRGVDVRIVTPAVADKKIVKVMTKSSYPHLMDAGVKIFEYTPGFIHEKLLISDDLCAVVGTVNLDYRSLVHHYENGVEIYNSPTVICLREEFLKTLSVSLLVEKDSARLSFGERIIRNAVRMFAPLL